MRPTPPCLQAGPLAAGLPASLRRAVHRKAVPEDLEADLLRLAAALDPLVPKISSAAAQLPALAAQAAERIPAAAEQVAQARIPASWGPGHGCGVHEHC